MIERRAASNPLTKSADWVYQLYRSSHSIVGFAASLVGLASVVIWAVQLFTGDAAQWVLAAFVCAVASGCLLLAIYMQHRYHEERRYSGRGMALQQAMPAFEAHLGHLRDALLHSSEKATSDKVRSDGDRAAQSLAEAFGTVTRSACRVTVKETYMHKEELAVRDLFRSSASNYVSPDGSPDLVRDNTDFEEVVRKGGTRWLVDNIVEEKGYKNSHITREQLQADEVSYRAVLVTAIAAKDERGQIDLLGFLCVDSTSPGVFRESPDVSAAQASANALYSVLRWFQRVNQVSSGGSQ